MRDFNVKCGNCTHGSAQDAGFEILVCTIPRPRMNSELVKLNAEIVTIYSTIKLASELLINNYSI